MKSTSLPLPNSTSLHCIELHALWLLLRSHTLGLGFYHSDREKTLLKLQCHVVKSTKEYSSSCHFSSSFFITAAKTESVGSYTILYVYIYIFEHIRIYSYVRERILDEWRLKYSNYNTISSAIDTDEYPYLLKII